jgi:hypothetical protein
LSSSWRTDPQASLSLPKASDTPTSDAAGMRQEQREGHGKGKADYKRAHDAPYPG